MPELRYEFRVRWQREGEGRCSKLYQSEQMARRWCMKLEGRMEELTGLNPDDFACCSGAECGCGGALNRDVWEQEAAKYPPLVFGPVVDTREVGDWQQSGDTPWPPWRCCMRRSAMAAGLDSRRRSRALAARWRL
jgi:hypothetical protein